MCLPILCLYSTDRKILHQIGWNRRLLITRIITDYTDKSWLTELPYGHVTSWPKENLKKEKEKISNNQLVKIVNR